MLDLSKIDRIKDPTKVKIEKIKIDDSHNSIAFSVDLEGLEEFTTFVMDIASKEIKLVI